MALLLLSIYMVLLKLLPLHRGLSWHLEIKKIGREGGKKSKHFSLLLLSLPTHPLELGEPQMGHSSEFLNTEHISDGDIKLRRITGTPYR